MVLLASPPGGSRPNSSLLGDRRMIANVRAERLLKIPAEPSPELRIPGAAAQTRVVSMAGIRLGSWESARAFKGIICDDISEFESHMPSQAVGLSASLLVSAGGDPCVFAEVIFDRVRGSVPSTRGRHQITLSP
jgi:hypothetical protein